MNECEWKKRYSKAIKPIQYGKIKTYKNVCLKVGSMLFLKWDKDFSVLNTKLTEKLIISLNLFMINKDKELSIPSINYIKKQGYFKRLKENDKQNGYTYSYKKRPYTKYIGYKKRELIDKIFSLENWLWRSQLKVRELEEKYENKPLNLVVFE